jgi:hypothetical protein
VASNFRISCQTPTVRTEEFHVRKGIIGDPHVDNAGDDSEAQWPVRIFGRDSKFEMEDASFEETPDWAGDCADPFEEVVVVGIDVAVPDWRLLQLAHFLRKPPVNPAPSLYAIATSSYPYFNAKPSLYPIAT